MLQWNPEVATQLVVASDDDRSPTLQMWDLRNSVSPLKEFVGHSKVINKLFRAGGRGWGLVPDVGPDVGPAQQRVTFQGVCRPQQ